MGLATLEVSRAYRSAEPEARAMERDTFRPETATIQDVRRLSSRAKSGGEGGIDAARLWEVACSSESEAVRRAAARACGINELAAMAGRG
jgi:hypothetical protein